MRYQCDIPGHEACWIEFDEQWTRGEAKGYIVGRDDAAKLAAIAHKIAGLHLRTGATVIERAADLTVANLDKLEFKLAIWFDQAVIREIERLDAAATEAAKQWLTQVKAGPAPLDRKYSCGLPGYEDCFVQIGEEWTRGDIIAFETTGGQPFVDLVRSKLVAVHLRGKTTITEPAAFTLANTEGLDYFVWRWLVTALQRGKDDLHDMGEAIARRSLRASA